MADSSQNTTGLAAYLFIFALAIVTTVSLQETVIKGSIDAVFPNYEFITNVIPGEWIIMSRDLTPKDEFGSQREKLNDIVFKISYNFV